jgi:hypothetical protein
VIEFITTLTVNLNIIEWKSLKASMANDIFIHCECRFWDRNNFCPIFMLVLRLVLVLVLCPECFVGKAHYLTMSVSMSVSVSVSVSV